MLELLQSLVLGVHLLAMNVASAGPLVCPVLQWWEASAGDRIVGWVGRRVAGLSIVCFLVGTLLGLASGGLLWVAGEVRFFEAMGRLPSKVYFGVWELGFYVICMGIYWLWWWLAPPRWVGARVAHAIVGLAAATNLLWHFPPLMTSIAHLAVAAPTGEAIDAAGFRHLILTPEIMSRCIHIWLAGLATTGILIAWLSVRKSSDAAEQAGAARLTAFGGRLALAATLLQLPVGMWLLIQSPAAEQSRLMGGSLLPTALLVASIIAALALLHQLSAIALGDGGRRHIRWSAALLVVTVLMMSATLRLARGDAWKVAGTLRVPSAESGAESNRSGRHAERACYHYPSPSIIWQ